MNNSVNKDDLARIVFEEAANFRLYHSALVEVFHRHGFAFTEYRGRWHVMSKRKHDAGIRLSPKEGFDNLEIMLEFILSEIQKAKANAL